MLLLFPRDSFLDHKNNFHFLSISLVMNILFIPISILWSICVITNLIVIMTFFRMRCLRYNYSYWYTTALAILDLILGSTGIHLHILITERIVPVDASICDMEISYQAALACPEIFLLLVMAIDCFNVSNLQMNNNPRRSAIRYFLIISTSSVMELVMF